MSTTFYTPVNNVESTLASAHTIGDGQLTLVDASDFPEVCRVSVGSAIFAVSAKIGNVLTIDSAIEDTADVALSAGEVVEMRMTAGYLTDIHSAVNALEVDLPLVSGQIPTTTSDLPEGTNLYHTEERVSEILASHSGNFSNPHQVTAAQVGTYESGTISDLMETHNHSGMVPGDGTIKFFQGGSTITLAPISNCFALELSSSAQGELFVKGQVRSNAGFNTSTGGNGVGVYPNIVGINNGAGFKIEGNGAVGTYIQFVAVPVGGSQTVLIESVAGGGSQYGGTTFFSPSADAVPARFRGHATQSGNLTNWENSSSTTLASVDYQGGFHPGSMTDAQALNNSIYYSTTQSKLVYKDAGGVVNNLY